MSLFVFLWSLLALAQGPSGASASQEEAIQLWYGDTQRFGHLGEPQRWVNVLGSVDLDRIDSLTYRLNGSPPTGLTLGSDRHRLARPGDFNVELAWDDLREGKNQLVIADPGQAHRRTVSLDITRGRRWPLPYRLDFRQVDELQDLVQVVDGNWTLQSDGVRTAEPYYDRVLSMGDSSWTDYEALVRLTIHDFTPPEPGPPTYNVTHMGVALRWRGHHRDGRQPSRKWYPMGAQGEFLVRQPLDSCQWRILFGGDRRVKPVRWAEGANKLQLGRPMLIRAQVATMPDGRSRYRFKQWMAADTEPEDWSVTGYEPNDYPSGALCLVPHNTDVTIHRVDVVPLSAPHSD